MRLEALFDPSVVLMIGASGSGKSTLAGALAAANPGFGVVSYDSYQRQLPGDNGWQTCTAAAVDLAHAELVQRCAAGVGTIIDGTHRQPDRRAAVRAIAAAYRLPVVAVALVVPLSQCLARQRTRTRHVPREDIVVQHAAITEALPRLHHEGYAVVLVLDGSMWWQVDQRHVVMVPAAGGVRLAAPGARTHTSPYTRLHANEHAGFG